MGVLVVRDWNLHFFMNKVVRFYKNRNIEPIKGEIWKDIPGFEGLYLVSNLGRFRSLPREKRGAWGNLVMTKDKILVPCVTVNKYLQIALSKNGVVTYRHAHIWVAIAFIPNPENKPEVNHKYGIKWDNRATELEWATGAENMKHAIENGLNKQVGDKHHGALLTNKQVLEIFNSKKTNRELADKYNIRINEVSRIKRGETWSRITGKLHISKKIVPS